MRSIERGTVLLGKYRVDSVIGRGGMGLVLKAWHLGLDEEVAIKVLRDDVAIADETVARFIREAQAAAKLKSEHIARIIDVGTFGDGKPYLVMELLEGQDIGQLLAEQGRLQSSLAIDLVIQACEGLAEAHSLGIIHRDIKPTNLFLTSRPDGSLLLKLLDFGISKSPAGAELSLTQTWSLLGSPAYMSPEQMRSARHVDVRTDIWSLGAVLYEAIEGHLPFQAESFSEMCVMVAVDSPAPTAVTPRELLPIIGRCLAKRPDDRYRNVADLASDLACLAREPDKAQLIVDRMYRMLRRGAMRRTPASGVPLTGTPSPDALPGRASPFPFPTQVPAPSGLVPAGRASPFPFPQPGASVPSLAVPVPAPLPAAAPAELPPSRPAQRLPTSESLSGPTRAASANGLPVAASANVLPVAASANGFPTSASAHGFPTSASANGFTRAASANGFPTTISASGMPAAASANGFARAASANGLPAAASANGFTRAASANGFPTTVSASGMPAAASANGFAHAASASGMPAAASANGLPAAASANGLPRFPESSPASGMPVATVAVQFVASSMPGGAPLAAVAGTPPPNGFPIPSYPVSLPMRPNGDARYLRPGFSVPRGGTSLTTTHVITRRRERGWVVILAAAIVVLMIAIGVMLVARWSTPAPPPPVDDGPTVVRMHHVPAPPPAAGDSASQPAPATPPPASPRR